ncbi:MAG: GNAT family N-acetyltransferase, partial [Actinocrinis sp.]
MTDPSALLAAYDEYTRARIPLNAPAGLTFEWDGPLLRTVGQHRGFVETTADPRVRGAELDALIARQREYFAARGEAVEWKTRGHDKPDDLVDRLLAAGFVPEERETVLIGEAAELAAEPVLPAGVTLRQVFDPKDLERIAAMHGEIWGLDQDWLAADLAGRIAAEPETFAVFAAEAEADAGPLTVCAAWITLKEGTEFAGLWGGSTLEAWRGKGIYRATVARRAQLAVAH